MKNKGFLIGALVAAVVALGAVAYFGVGHGQQASVATALTGTTATSVTSSTIPNVVYPGLEKEAKAYTDSVTALEKKIQTLPSIGEKRAVYLGNGWCATMGPLGGNVHIFPC